MEIDQKLLCEEYLEIMESVKGNPFGHMVKIEIDRKGFQMKDEYNTSMMIGEIVGNIYFDIKKSGYWNFIHLGVLYKQLISENGEQCALRLRQIILLALDEVIFNKFLNMIGGEDDSYLVAKEKDVIAKKNLEDKVRPLFYPKDSVVA